MQINLHQQSLFLNLGKITTKFRKNVRKKQTIVHNNIKMQFLLGVFMILSFFYRIFEGLN